MSKFLNEQQAKEAESIQIGLRELKITPTRTDDYRLSSTKIIDILHMDLDVKFNFTKHECMGKARLMLKPYFYQSDSIVLDAQNMIIDGISITRLDGHELLHEMNYNQKKLILKLETLLSSMDTVLVNISYIARPDLNVQEKGSAIRDAKGLYFINTDKKEPYKPTQIWTQGETESNSNWFPTIDKPNEKFTSSLTISVDKHYTILSNGKLVSSIEANDLKTERWENTKPMSAYLMMMAIGEFEKTIDHYKDKEVSYYLESTYAPFARNIFDQTKEMIAFYSTIFGVDYPWDKYAQVVVRDYVSGAMENTSATLHGEFVQKNQRELVDGGNEGIISHELVHQWFGDLVTCNSWSQLFLNEGFATFGEWLWIEHQHGKEDYLKKAFETNQRYINYGNSNLDKPIVDYNYKKPDDMFNVITYQKGALVLNLLRNELGDEAFFVSLKNYLSKYAYSEAHLDDLRREFERVSGRDLRLFFNQWFLKGGHPKIEVRYDFNDSLKTISVTIEQKQEDNLFTFPLQFKLKHGEKVEYTKFMISKRKEIFQVKQLEKDRADFPEIFIDPQSTFIGEINDIKPIIKTLNQYSQADTYVDKIRSIKAMANQQGQYDTARALLLSSINDRHYGIRLESLALINWKDVRNVNQAKEVLTELALHDESALVRASAMKIISGFLSSEHQSCFLQGIYDSSYTVAGYALEGLSRINSEDALKLCSKLEKDAKGELFTQISAIYANFGNEESVAFFNENLFKTFKRTRANLLVDYTDLMIRLKLPSAESGILEDLLKKYAAIDENAIVRYTAMNALNELEKAYRVKSANEKDEMFKLDYERKITQLSKDIQNLVNNEKDTNTLSLLRTKGMIPMP